MSFAYKYKKIILLFILITFLAVMFLGLNNMMQAFDINMSGGCPFSTMGSSLCSFNSTAMVFHHISLYQSFINVPINFNTIGIILLLFISSIAFVFLIKNPLDKFLISIKRIINFPLYIPYVKKILDWLSIFENSPSLL